MPTARSAWGIDVGNRALKAIKLVREGDQVKIDDFEIIEHESILSDAGDNKESLLQSSLANFLQRHEPGSLPVGVGVAGQATFARFIKLPPVEAKKIPEIVRFEAVQQIPFPLDDVEWSYQLFQQADSPDVEVGIFAMRKELVAKQIGYFTGVGLNVQVVQINPLAIYNAMYFDKRISGTTLFMDIGAENTDLIIAEGETVWLRTLPIAGNNFTEALAKQFKLTFAKAEELKRNAATSKYARQIFQAMRPVFADLVSEVQRSIGFYASVHRDARIKRIISLGSTFRLPGLQKYLQQNLQLPVERLDAFSAAMPADGKQAGVFNENMLSLASAYGLALQALGDTKITASLLPERIRRAKIWQEKTKWFAAAAAIILAAVVGGAYGRIYKEKWGWEQNEPQRADAIKTKNDAQSAADKWKGVISTGTKDQERVRDALKLSDGRDLWPMLLADIGTQFAPRLGPTSDIVNTLRSMPRSERRMVVIDSVKSLYTADVNQYLNMPDNKFNSQVFGAEGAAGMAPDMPVGGMGSGDPRSVPVTPRASAGQTENRGFVLTISGRTPNSSGAGYVESLVSDWKKVAAKGANRPYFIARTAIPLAQTVTLREGAGATPVVAPPAGGGFGPGYRPPMPPVMPVNPGNEAAAAPKVADPAFPGDELRDVRRDFEFTLTVVVVLQKPAK